MQLKPLNFEPVYIAASAGNLLNPPTYSGGVGCGTNGMYVLVNRVQVVNNSNATYTFTLYKGLTGGSSGGTEIIGGTQSVAAYSDFVRGGLNIRFDIADFLSGIASSASKLTILIDGQIGVAG